MDKHVLTVAGAERGLSLLQLVATRLSLGQDEARERIVAGGVYLDGKRQAEAERRLEPGQKVLVWAGEAVVEQRPRLVLVDRWLAVVDKPAGLPSSATRRGSSGTVDAWARDTWGGGVRLVHRLDRDVSGLLLISRRGGATRKALAQALAGHRIARFYLARVRGRPSQRQFTMRRRITVERGRPRLSDDPRAKPAVTHASLLRQEGQTSLVRLRLETGRTHQIRLHLAGEGLPVLGDTRHGGPAASRLALHAHQLRLRHPKSRRWLDLHAPWPPELR